MEPVKIPRLDAPDAIFTWSVFRLSLRQFAVLLLAAVMAANLWSLLDLMGLDGVFQWMAVIIPALLAILFGWVRLYGQSFEYALAVMLRYSLRPRVAVFDQNGTGEEKK